MGEAAVLIPSEWYEAFPHAAVEAFAKGAPMTAANIRTVTELIDRGHTGLLFHPGDPEDLAPQVKEIPVHPSRLTAMRREVRAEFETKYTQLGETTKC
jgi:glycosyltransferase involved in cell wall biosynthesis